jgi:hypothetical protein
LPIKSEVSGARNRIFEREKMTKKSLGQEIEEAVKLARAGIRISEYIRDHVLPELDKEDYRSVASAMFQVGSRLLIERKDAQMLRVNLETVIDLAKRAGLQK